MVITEVRSGQVEARLAPEEAELLGLALLGYLGDVREGPHTLTVPETYYLETVASLMQMLAQLGHVQWNTSYGVWNWPKRDPAEPIFPEVRVDEEVGG